MRELMRQGASDRPVATLAQIAVCVPVLNAAGCWASFSSALKPQCVYPWQVIIIDSASDDDTRSLAISDGYKVIQIERSEFGHGATRQMAVSLVPEVDILVYLTQDAILANPNSLRNLLAAFDDPSVGAAFGRQLPRPNAGPIEAHARLYNYPGCSSIRSLDDRKVLGFKTIFLSNSFAAYRRSALEAVGGFPAHSIFGEDTIVAARMLLAGWKIAYVAEASAFHSHSYSWLQEFRRYFDIGVLHSRESWLLEQFGNAKGEGKRFVLSELRFLWDGHKALIPSAFVRTIAKFAGYKLGRMEAILSPRLKKRLSMHRSFWNEKRAASRPM